MPTYAIQDSPAVGKPGPEVDLVRLSDDATWDQAAPLQDGQVTLVHFWGTWCGPCRMEYPHLSEMTAQLSDDRRFRFISVSCESNNRETFNGLWLKTKDYFSQNAITDQMVYADPRGVTRTSLLDRLERPNLYYPTSVLVDGEGNIAGVWEGYTPSAVNQIRNVTDHLMAQCDR